MMHVIPGPRYVTVGYDGSSNSAVALRRAATEAQRLNARLDVVHVIPHGGFLQASTAWLRLRNDVARLIPRAQHVTTRLRIARGDVGTELAKLAQRAEVLVIGAGPDSRRDTPLGGETVPAVLSAVACKVIVCGDEPGDEDG
jgi:nucleotide-binding universal stress UspA family protein